MRVLTMKNYLCSALLLTALSWVAAGTVFGLNINMVAEQATVTMPGAAAVTMWGLRDTDDPGHAAGDWQVPVYKTSDAVLNISLTNDLPDDTASALAKPTSLIIPGLVASETDAMVPTWTDGSFGSRGGDPTKRVRSLTHETANQSGPVTYSWDLTPGTYLIQSGTHQAVQVQMGLYAVLVVYPAGTTDQAYGPGTTFTTEQVLAYSEIDTALHAAVAADDYGPGKSYTSTIGFDPDYYLINGQPFGSGNTSFNLGSDSNVLLRFVNAGYETRMPVLQGTYVQWLAEDGNLLPYPHEVYSLELTAGKTKDVLLVSSPSSQIAVYDARFHLTNGGVSGGGMLAYLTTPGTAGLIIPNGGEVWSRGSTYTIEWIDDPGTVNTYRLHYLDADGTPHPIASVGDVSTYEWTIPLNTLAEPGKSLRLTAFDGGTFLYRDFSDQGFTIAANVVPNGGEVFTEGQSYTLAWAPVVGADNYRLHYYDADNTPHSLANVGNVTSYNWTVPHSAFAESGKRFRVTPFNGTTRLTSAIQWSEGTFTIASQMFPNGGETLVVGQNYALTWASIPGADSYRVHYFDSGGAPHAISAVGDVTSINWTVPGDALPEAGKTLRVTAFSGPTKLTADVQWSDGSFTIAAP